MPTKQATTASRRECDNCGTWFDQNQAAPHKRFCRDSCRKEFWQTGGQFRKITRFAERLLPKLVEAAFTKQSTELAALRDEIRDERILIQQLVARYERAHAADLLVTQEIRTQNRGAAA
jgi:hypothetical protein